jgi:hypothetical protein
MSHPWLESFRPTKASVFYLALPDRRIRSFAQKEIPEAWQGDTRIPTGKPRAWGDIVALSRHQRTIVKTQ